MYEEILVPTDGSPGAAAAATRAVALARAFDGRVHALYVVRPPGEGDSFPDDATAAVRESAEAEGEAATGRVAETAVEADVDVVREVREGLPHRAILEYADEAGIDLVVVGTHGRTGAGHGRVGSTSERVVTLADVPVLVVPAAGTVGVEGPGDVSVDQVVVPTDGSDVAGRAADHALEIAARYDADVHAVYVVDATSHDLEQVPRSIVGLLKEGGRNAVETVADGGRERGLPVSTQILRGVPETAILQYASGVDADLLAMGTRGRSSAAGYFLGSTTARVIRRSTVPVLVVS